MAIKTRLIMAMAALLCLATVVIGMVATTAVERAMTSNVDDQLNEFMRQASQVTSARDVRDDAAGSEPLAFQQVAVMLAHPDGTIAVAQPAGFADDPLPLPRLPSPLPSPSEPLTVPGANNRIEYRLLVGGDEAMALFPATEETEDLHLVAAMPMDQVNSVRNSLIFTMVVTVAAVLTVGIVAAWWITRRGMRPVTTMIDAAAAVADGDLDRRLPSRDHRTEIGKLATALNIMVSKLVDAITQRDAQQARLRRFIADASHELRTPLAAISGYAELYETGGVPPRPSLDRAISRIRGESHRMAALVDDLLLLARLDQETPQNRSPLDLRQLSYDAVDDARAADGGHQFHVHAPGPVIIDAAEDRLRQVVANLLGNARMHTPAGTTVEVTVLRHRNDAVLTVSDDGPGIPLVHRHRVFDRFYRADDSRSRDTGGTGLGLSIVKSIVEAHGGRVELESQLGRGTTVRVVLPLKDDVPAPTTRR
jgi:two-component system OmpR family sensor kinase